jgi:uncharacterized protein
MAEPPSNAVWRLVDAHEGFETLFRRAGSDGYRFEGYSVGVEDGDPWGFAYELVLDSGWATRSAHVVGDSTSGAHELRLEADGRGAWRIDGAPASHLDGCLDVDLEGSAFTNALPVHRLGLEVGERSEAPAAYVRAAGSAVERLEQSYARQADEGGRSRYDYASPGFGYEGVLTYDVHGLVLDYPGIAVRVA